MSDAEGLGIVDEHRTETAVGSQGSKVPGGLAGETWLCYSYHKLLPHPFRAGHDSMFLHFFFFLFLFGFVFFVFVFSLIFSFRFPIQYNVYVVPVVSSKMT